jgi:hypothetical protein
MALCERAFGRRTARLCLGMGHAFDQRASITTRPCASFFLVTMQTHTYDFVADTRQSNSMAKGPPPPPIVNRTPAQKATWVLGWIFLALMFVLPLPIGSMMKSYVAGMLTFVFCLVATIVMFAVNGKLRAKSASS